MPNADERHGDTDPAGSGAEPVLVADEAPEPVWLGGDPADAREGGEPQDPHQVILLCFQTVSQTLSEAYGVASLEIQKIVWRALRTYTTEDRTFIWGASGAIRQWVDSVRPAMACSGKSMERPIPTVGRRSAGRKRCPRVNP